MEIKNFSGRKYGLEGWKRFSCTKAFYQQPKKFSTKKSENEFDCLIYYIKIKISMNYPGESLDKY